MPEIKHTPMANAVAQSTAAAPDPNPVTVAPATPAKSVAESMLKAGVTVEALESEIDRILEDRKKARAAALQPREPDWAKLTEQDAYRQDIYIPVIEHDVPDYMNMKLKDAEYDVVWASKDQRRLGQLKAEGYELLKPEHVDPKFKLPLEFTSEGFYEYVDVIAMRVHKRILWGKRRKALDISQRQLKNSKGIPQQRIKGTFDLSSDEPNLEPGFSLYSTQG
jgi:hypothetical protein